MLPIVSLQEQFHVASAFEILLAPGHGCNFLYDMTLVQYTQLRATVIDLVLATDMKQHFSLLGQANTVGQCVWYALGHHTFALGHHTFALGHHTVPACHGCPSGWGSAGARDWWLLVYVAIMLCLPAMVVHLGGGD